MGAAPGGVGGGTSRDDARTQEVSMFQSYVCTRVRDYVHVCFGRTGWRQRGGQRKQHMTHGCKHHNRGGEWVSQGVRRIQVSRIV